MRIKKGFTLVELLIIVAIIAVLVAVAMPYYQNYVRDTKYSKAKHELDLLKEALIKFDTFEDKTFAELPEANRKLEVLLGKYLQSLNFDPWGRNYEVDPFKGQVKSLGPDHLDPKDDITVDYKPPLALQKVSWVDATNDNHVNTGDLVRFQFSRMLNGSQPITFTNIPNTAGDLLFSSEVQVGQFLATTTITSSTEFLVAISGSGTFMPGSSTVRVASGNVNLRDIAGRKANGTAGEYPALDVVILGN